MTKRKPLVVAVGQIEQIQTGDSLDASISGGQVVSQTNDEATPLVIGAPVYNDANDGAKRARANAATTARVLGLVAETGSIAAGAQGNIQTSGFLAATTGQWDAVTGDVGGLVFGALYYVDASTAGKLTRTPPSAGGQYVAAVGLGISTTEMVVRVFPVTEVPAATPLLWTQTWTADRSATGGPAAGASMANMTGSVIGGTLSMNPLDFFWNLLTSYTENLWTCVMSGTGTRPAAHQALHAYVTVNNGSQAIDVVANAGNVYMCITSGNSGAASPPTTTSQDITDGTVHWRYIGPDVASAVSTTGDLIGNNLGALVGVGAYKILKSPDGKRFIVIQKGTLAHAWLTAQSIGGFNADGTATVLPTPITAGDYKGLAGNRATPAPVLQFTPNSVLNTPWNASYSIRNGARTDVALWGGVAVWNFNSIASTIGNVIAGGFVIDPLLYPTDPQDPDPCVYFCAANAGVGLDAFNCSSNGAASANLGGTSTDDTARGGPRAWYGKGATGGDFVDSPLMSYTEPSGTVLPLQTCGSLLSNSDTPLIACYGRSINITGGSVPSGVKGFSSVFRLASQAGLAIGTLVGWSAPGANDGLLVGEVIIPWPSGVKLARQQGAQ